MSSALVWQLIKNNNAFLIKRGNTKRDGFVELSAEPGNLLNVNSAKYSGLANETTVGVSADLTVSVKDSKNANKPSKSYTAQKLSLHTGKSAAKVTAAVKDARADLTKLAVLRYKKSARALSIKKGYSKKAVKSTRRN